MPAPTPLLKAYVRCLQQNFFLKNGKNLAKFDQHFVNATDVIFYICLHVLILHETIPHDVLLLLVLMDGMVMKSRYSIFIT